jgi:membrane protein DedA with SNARE-associated domain
LAILTIFEGPISTLLASAAASIGLMNPALVFFAAAAGNLTGDSGWYLLGRLGKIEWIARLAKRAGLPSSYLERLEGEMRRNAPTFLFFAKLFNSLIIPALVTAGLTRVPWRRWFPPVLAAEILWTGSLVLIGYFSVQALGKVERGLPWVGLFTAMIFFLALLGYLWKSMRKRKSEEILENHAESW